MERNEQSRIVEALVLAAPEPISAERLADLVPDCSAGLARDLVTGLNESYSKEDRAFEIWEVAGGFQIRTRAEFSGVLQQLRRLRPLRLSQAALETLSIVAYKQPVTRAEIEDVRGVEAGPVLKTLLERRLVRMAGHRDVPGRPMLYATTKRFLEVFGLGSAKDLPRLRELEELAREQRLAEAEAHAESGGEGPAAGAAGTAAPDVDASADPGAADGEGSGSKPEADE
jgi:segregation and condensation protein B